jgi:hypothetical protein
MVIQNENQYAHPNANPAAGSTKIDVHWMNAEGRGYMTAISPMECATAQIMVPLSKYPMKIEAGPPL